MTTVEKFTSDEISEAAKFGEFFIDLIENHKSSLFFYLANTAVLDWFGHTIKGPKNIGTYLKNNAGKYIHRVANARPVDSIGFRDTHNIKRIRETTQSIDTSSSAIENNEITPPKLTFTPATHTDLTEMGQGDGPHNCDSLESPIKKCKLDMGEGDASGQEMQMKYISTEGSIQFIKKSSKKLQGETKWNRQCKLEVAYTTTNFQDCTIYLIIYQGNVKCRRNLLKDFGTTEPND